jgi:hypothetical protein
MDWPGILALSWWQTWPRYCMNFLNYMWDTSVFNVFYEPLLNRGNHYVRLSFCLSVCQSACISAAPNRPISVKFDITDFFKIFRERANLVEIEQIHRARYMKRFHCCRRHVFVIKRFLAALSIVVLLTVSCTSTTHIKHIVAFPQLYP